MHVLLGTVCVSPEQFDLIIGMKTRIRLGGWHDVMT